ncbi:zinc finger protein 536 [Grus japonensis]|uniref:Zinc finger protein 536 n=1 Tax=Grus japonensis TaxID=30415 RepID=A0ABC9XD42_GRUJA
MDRSSSNVVGLSISVQAAVAIHPKPLQLVLQEFLVMAGGGPGRLGLLQQPRRSSVSNISTKEICLHETETFEAFQIFLSHRPFQCRYCPYSASQKGNLKTHVLCVHRMPFDNSQYPDRRFKRSRVDSEASGNLEEPAAVKAGSSAELTEEGSKAQE